MHDHISMDKDYVTKSGDDVRILCVDSENKLYPIVGLIHGMIYSWTAEGINDLTLSEGTKFDLIEKQKIKSTFMNVYEDGYIGGNNKSISDCYRVRVETHGKHYGYIRIDVRPLNMDENSVHISYVEAKETDNI